MLYRLQDGASQIDLRTGERRHVGGPRKDRNDQPTALRRKIKQALPSPEDHARDMGPMRQGNSRFVSAASQRVDGYQPRIAKTAMSQVDWSIEDRNADLWIARRELS
jgi:hypothetical protein